MPRPAEDKKASKKKAAAAPEKEEKKEKKPSSSKSAKPADGGKAGKGGRATAPAPAPAPAPRRPPPRVAPGAPPPSDDYLAGVDLPSSSDSESDASSSGGRRRPLFADGEAPAAAVARGASAKESRKLALRDRKALEAQAAAKAAALRDDDSAFDVAFERQGDGDGAATLSATDVVVHSLTIRAKGKVLLENTTCTIAAGRRYGLVGPNGMGKSTLLRMIARRQIPVPENLDVLLVEQEVVGSDESALASVVAADAELMALRAEEAEINARLAAVDLAEGAASGADGAGAAPPADSDEEGELGERLNEVYDRIAILGGASAEARAAKILHGLGFDEPMRRRATRLFSGGWRMRISLARALYLQPALLLLDEPTNHLDLRAVLWLEEYLTRWKKTLVVVSHDREFLNSVTTDIVHLHDLGLHYYRGNFAQFEEMYEQRRREVNKEFDRHAKAVKAAKQSGSRTAKDKVAKDVKAKARQREKGGGRGGAGGGTEDAAGASRGDGPRQWADYTVKFDFPEPTELPPPLLQLIDASFAYPGRDDFGLAGLNIGVDMGSRVAIVGPNGAGKTTLLNLLAGDLEPKAGEQRRSHKLRVGRYNQHFVDALAFDTSAVEYLTTKFPDSGLRPEDVRAKLGRFGLSGHHHLQPICKLSGGQKARVVFAAIALSNPHILLLDEPTNHLDMQSIDALADALEEYEGGVIIISHDARLLARVCDDAERAEVWIVEGGKVQNYDGDFADYKAALTREIAAEMDADEREAAAAAGRAAGVAAPAADGWTGLQL